MADQKKKTTAKTPSAPAPEFASKEEVNNLSKNVSSLMEIMLERFGAIDAKLNAAPVVAPTKEEKEVAAAGPDRFETNPDWDQTAREILGEYLDHTEVAHDKSGGIKFTVVIKKEKSNAPGDYLMMVKSDRRTREVGSLGLEGVIEWCRLIRANLKKSETK